MELFRQEVPVPVEPEPEIETESLGHAPRVGRVRAVGPQAIHRLGWIAQQVHLERRAVAQDVDDVSIGSGRIALRGEVAENLPADLEVVIAQPAVPEVARGPEQLVAPNVELANARGPGQEIVPKVLVARRGRVIRIGPIESILSRA